MKISKKTRKTATRALRISISSLKLLLNGRTSEEQGRIKEIVYDMSQALEELEKK